MHAGIKIDAKDLFKSNLEVSRKAWKIEPEWTIGKGVERKTDEIWMKSRPSMERIQDASIWQTLSLMLMIKGEVIASQESWKRVRFVPGEWEINAKTLRKVK